MRKLRFKENNMRQRYTASLNGKASMPSDLGPLNSITNLGENEIFSTYLI